MHQRFDPLKGFAGAIEYVGPGLGVGRTLRLYRDKRPQSDRNSLKSSLG
jgi:hypothetical protein